MISSGGSNFLLLSFAVPLFVAVLRHPYGAVNAFACTPKEECNQIFIDISHHKGRIDWKQVVERNPDKWDKAKKLIAITKATEGSHFVDHRLEENLRGMSEAGIARRGVYHYFRGARNSPSADAQVDHFIDTITKAGFDPANDFIAVDVEKGYNGGSNKAQFTEKLFNVVKQLNERVPTPLYIYTSQDGWNNLVSNKYDAFFGQFPLWVANYVPNWRARKPKMPRTWANKRARMWQYSENGRVNGISPTQRVDMNVIQW